MEKQKILSILKNHQVRVTPIRKELLKLFLESPCALSNKDIEISLDDIDRSTIFRSIKTFISKGIIHLVYDGSNTKKYALCSDYCSPISHYDDHVHFKCHRCKKTFCIDNLSVPEINLPEGYRSDSIKMIVNGICKHCL